MRQTLAAVILLFSFVKVSETLIFFWSSTPVISFFKCIYFF